MKLTKENVKEHAQNVMTQKDVEGYNKLNGTKYPDRDALLDGETERDLLAFFQ